MIPEVSFVIITPRALEKARMGGILSRLLSRPNLELIAAAMIAPNRETADAYADSIMKHADPSRPGEAELLADYVRSRLAPGENGPRRAAVFLLRGENAAGRLTEQAGAPDPRFRDKSSGITIRDTFADLIRSEDGEPVYFEPAVLTPRCTAEARDGLRILSNAANAVDAADTATALDNPADSDAVQRTLVILKPDNWRCASVRPGAVIDMLSRTGLRIAGIKVHYMSVSQALEFYGQVKTALEKKLAPSAGARAASVLEKELSIGLNSDVRAALELSVGGAYAHHQFGDIVQFMSGRRPESVSPDEADKPGSAQTMILVYEGENAVEKIRDVLGPTNPQDAPGGTVRADFGSDIMVNAVHASDSPESARREFDIVKVRENNFSALAQRYLDG